MTKLTEEAKAENEMNAKKRKLEEKAVRDSDVKGEVELPIKTVPDSPNPSDPDRWENDPRKNPKAPGGVDAA